MPLNREPMMNDDQAFDAFVYAGFAEQVDKLARGYAKATAAKQRLQEQANPKPVTRRHHETTAEALTHADDGKPSKGKSGKPVTVTDRQIISETDTHVGAGRDNSKERQIQALTLVELLYNARLIDMNTLMAADRFRVLHLEHREGYSQGVGGYGNNPGGSNPWAKADRIGRRLTGYEVNGNEWKRGKRPNTNSYDYEAALLAMCGVIDVEGRRVHDNELKRIMISAAVDTVNIQTQAQVARLRTGYTGPKQLPPAGATVITEALRRLALYLGYGGSR